MPQLLEQRRQQRQAAAAAAGGDDSDADEAMRGNDEGGGGQEGEEGEEQQQGVQCATVDSFQVRDYLGPMPGGGHATRMPDPHRLRRGTAGSSGA